MWLYKKNIYQNKHLPLADLENLDIIVNSAF